MQTSRNACMMAVVAALVAVANAADKVWDGGGGVDTSWTNAANWDGDTLPVAGDNVTFASAGSAASLDSIADIGSVTINRTFTLSGAGILNMTAGLSVTADNPTIAMEIGGAGGVNLAGGGVYRLDNPANSFVGPVFVTGGQLRFNDSSDGYFGHPDNPMTFSGGVALNLNGKTWNPAAGRVITLDAGGLSLETSHGTWTLDDSDQLRGSGPLKGSTSAWGWDLNLNAAQTNFSGGLAMDSGSRQCTVSATVTGALGRGTVHASRYLTVNYIWGAQLAVDDAAAGVRVESGANINLQGNVPDPAALRDRFIVGPGSAVGGSATQLGYLTRVSTFSPAPATGAEIVLNRDALVLHYNADTGTVRNLGRNADLLFGLGDLINTDAFRLTIGSGTPWKGLGLVNGQGWFAETDIRLDRGTVTLDTGGGTLDEFVLAGNGITYGGAQRAFRIGNGANTPSFVAVGDPIPARIFNAVKLDTTVAGFAADISRWIVGGPAVGWLTALRADGFDGRPIDIEHQGYVQQYNAASTIATLRYEGQSILALNQNGTPTRLTADSLAQTAPGILMITPHTGRANLGQTEQFHVTGYPVGPVVDDAVIIADLDQNRPEMAECSVTDGWRVATYDATDINTAARGDLVKVTGADQTLAADAELLGLVLGRRIIGTGKTLRVGRRADGTAAAFAMVLGYSEGTPRIDPDLDFGASHGILYFRFGTAWSQPFHLYGALHGSNGLTIWSSTALARALRVHHAANTLGGEVTFLEGYVTVSAGNGFHGCRLDIKRGAILTQETALQSVDALRGGGRLDLDAGRTLTVAGDFVPGDERGGRLTVGGAGTLALIEPAVFGCTLDGAAADAATPRAVLTDAELSVAPGTQVRVDRLLNAAAFQVSEQTFTLLTAQRITGRFAGRAVLPPDETGLVGVVVTDTSSVPYAVRLTIRRPRGVVMQLR